MRNTQRKGDIAKAKAISTFTSNGFDVSLPFTESAAYDLVVDTGSKLYRVQVKYSSGKEVDLRRIHSNSKGYIVKKYEESSYDWLYVYRPGGEEFLISGVRYTQSTITPQPSNTIQEFFRRGDRVV